MEHGSLLLDLGLRCLSGSSWICRASALTFGKTNNMGTPVASGAAAAVK